MNFLKKIIKNILKKNNWRLEKIVIPKEYNLTTPSQNLVSSMVECKGILHVGAHRGSEAPVYEWFGKKTIWIEANPKIFSALKDNLIKYKFQDSYCELMLDEIGKEYKFNISNNDGASSSIFDFGDLVTGKNRFWKNRNFEMVENIKIKSNTLDNFIKINNIDIKKYDHWIIDVQGSELQFFKGALESLNHCNSINVEVSKGEVYKNGSKWIDVKNLLEKYGFHPEKEPHKDHMDVLFEKIKK